MLVPPWEGDPAPGRQQDSHVPGKFRDEVAKSVRRELSNRFTPMNKSILEKIFEQVVDGEELVAAFPKDKESKGILKDLAEKI